MIWKLEWFEIVDEGPEPLPPPPYACGRRNGKIDQRITFPVNIRSIYITQIEYRIND